jgi:glucose-1-phosphate thymidylyltransferase
MKIIIPMAGRGSRLRPHTLTVPKPLLPIAGKPMVQRLVEDLIATLPMTVDEIAFVIGDFGSAIEQQLMGIARAVGATGTIYHQNEPLGPGHAILCAGPSLEGPCLIAFSDTLFKANFNFDTAAEGIIWLQEVADPSSFGVVKIDDDGYISDFVEKPATFVSNKAIVGIYYVKDGGALRQELQRLVDEDIREKGEYQLTTALEHLKQNGTHFQPANIEEWLDCGNKSNVLNTNQRMLQLKAPTEALIADTVQLENTVIIPPCFIGDEVSISDSVIGPFASIGAHSKIKHSIVRNSLIQSHSHITEAHLQGAMLGSHVKCKGRPLNISLGDYSKV